MSLSEIRVNTTKTRTGVGTITYTETGPVITGIATASNFKTGSTNVHSTGVELTNINTGGATATFGGAISGTTASFSGNVSIGGTLTYEDVTNIDSVGILTARNGIRVGANGTKRENVHLDAGDSGANYLRFTNTTTGNGSADGFNIGINADEEVLLWNFENKSTIFATNNTERLLIDNNGKVLIGDSATYSPNGLLHIVGDDNSNGPELYLQVNNNNTTDNIGALWFGNNVDKSLVKLAGHTHTANNTADFTVSTSSGGTLGERLRITSGGCVYANNFGVGTDSNWKIRPNNSYTELAFEYSTSSTLADTNIKMFLNPSGRVLVKTVPLAAGGTMGDYGLMFQASTTPTDGQVIQGITFNPHSTQVARARAGIAALANANGGSHPQSGADLVFMTRYSADGHDLDVATDERLRITSGGDVLLGTHQATIGMYTSDGSDNKYWSLCGGSDASQSRGAVVTIYGNESANADNKLGTLSLKSGNTTSGFIDFWTQGAKKAEITKDGVFRIQSTYDGSTSTSNAYPALNITNLQGTYTANNILGGVTFGKAAGHVNGIRAGILAIYQGNGSNAGNVGAHLSFRTSSNGSGDSTEKLFISDNGVICTGNYRGLLDQTLGAVQINGGTSGGRLSFRGTTSTPGGGLGEMHGWWDSNKVASILFHAGSNNGAKDNGQIKMYARRTGGSSDCRLLVKDNGCEFFGNSNIFYGGQSSENLNGDVTIRSVGSAVYQNLRFMSSDGTNNGSIVGYYGGAIMFFNSTSYVWSINSQGERLELSNTTLSPRATSTVLDLGTDTKQYRRAYVDNAYPTHSTTQNITGSSFSSGSWYDTGFRRDSMGGLDINGTYIITAYADTYSAGGGNYACTYTWIVGIRNSSTNQNAANDVPLLSVTGHSTNNQVLALRTVRQTSGSGGQEYIQWKASSTWTSLDNSSGGRVLRFKAQRIGRADAT